MILFAPQLPLILMFRALVFVFCLTITNFGIAQLNPAVLRCVSINNQGDVTLTWSAPTGPGPLSQFVSYEVLRSPNIGGPFTTVASLNFIGTTTYTDLGANPTFAPVFYAIEVIYNDGTGNQSAGLSDIGQPMILTNTATSSFGILNWNAVSIPQLQGASPNYNIQRRAVNQVNFVAVGQAAVGFEQYFDTVYNCQIDMVYQITQQGQGCISSSILDTVTYRDSDPPTIPIIDSVSINPLTGELIIGWQSGGSPDEVSYVVAVDSLGLFRNDSVFVGGPLLYTKLLDSLTSLLPSRATVAAVDSCGNSSPSANTHTTIFLDGAVDLCDAEVTLNWTDYIGWTVANYNVLVSINGGEFQLLESFPNGTNQFIHRDVDLTANYRYIVRASRSGATGSTTSNLYNGEFNVPELPDFHYVNTATVEDDNSVLVELYTDSTFEAKSLRVLRSTFSDGPYINVLTRNYPLASGIQSLIDSQAVSNSFPYFYKVEIIDSCDQSILVSNVSRTLFLEGKYDRINGEVELRWNAYQGWETNSLGVRNYTVFRQTAGRGVEAIDSLVNLIPVTDLVFELTPSEHEICYYVVANINGQNAFGFRPASRSNQYCIADIPEVWLPNAFTPNNDDHNQTFQPRGYFVSSDQYLFQVFNRWGEIIFETNDPTIGWDGTFDQNLQPTGIYPYRLEITNPEGLNKILHGAVKLIR